MFPSAVQLFNISYQLEFNFNLKLIKLFKIFE